MEFILDKFEIITTDGVRMVRDTHFVRPHHERYINKDGEVKVRIDSIKCKNKRFMSE